MSVCQAQTRCDEADKRADVPPRQGLPRLSLSPTAISPPWANQLTLHWTRSTRSALPFLPSIVLMADGAQQIHAALRAGYRSGKAKSIKYRKHQLLQLAYLLQDNRERFNEAIKNDLGRSSLENEMYVNSRRALAKQLKSRPVGSRPSCHSRRSNRVLITSRNGPSQNLLPFPSTL